MKNKTRFYNILLMLIILLTGCKGIGNKDFKADTLIENDFEYKDDLNRYEIDITINEEEKSYTGKQKTTFRNNTGAELEEIYFRLYPNVFKSIDTAPNMTGTPYKEETFKKGFIDMEDVSINGKSLKYKIEGKDETILRVELEKPLLKDSKIEIDMKYLAKLPRSQERFGYGENTMNFGNWYPVLSVYDEAGWSKDPYYPIGDPFYTDVSNYDVNITVDKDLIIASSGNIIEEKIKDKAKTYKIEGKLIRDFAFAASKDFKIAEEKLDDTLVKLYYLDNDLSMVKEALKYSMDSIKTFNERFGRYPYGTYSLVATEFSGGMEYPNLVFINKEYFTKEAKKTLEQVIVHETAHQWWYGLVGNDQVKEAWLDEGLTSYSEVLYMDQIYGEEEGDLYFEDNFQYGYDIMEEYLYGLDSRVNKPLSEFKDWSDYGPLVYTKSAVFLRDIENKYGKDMLIKILSTYLQDYKYKIATTRDFLNICEKITGDSFESMEDKWLK